MQSDLQEQKKYPAVDEKNMLTFSKVTYEKYNHVYYTRPTSFFNDKISEPKSSFNEKLILDILKNDPLVNISFKSSKLSTDDKTSFLNFHKPRKLDLTFSLFLHVILIYNLAQISLIDNQNQFVEISFGLSPELANISGPEIPDTQKSDENTPQEALKTQQQLPQLTKNAAPEIEPPKQNQEMNLPPDENKKSDSEKQRLNIKNNENQQKISMEDFLKRKEKDIRKVGEKEKLGNKNNTAHNKTNPKQKIDAVPTSPFASYSIPNAPKGLTPAGAENGKDVQVYDLYKSYLYAQLKLNWNVSEFTNTTKNLDVIVSFSINQYGYLINQPKISRTSSNKEFDKMALNTVINTFPVSTPPPKELKTPLIYEAKFNLNDIM